jgi:hypothetical protein
VIAPQFDLDQPADLRGRHVAGAGTQAAKMTYLKLFAFLVDNFVDEGPKIRPKPDRARLWQGCLHFTQCYGSRNACHRVQGILDGNKTPRS